MGYASLPIILLKGQLHSCDLVRQCLRYDSEQLNNS